MKKNKLRQYYHRYFKRGFSGITASSRVFPDFIIIGTVRSGTTSLYYNICKHKSILPAAYDEIGFFDSNYNLGTDWYRSMFPTQKEMRNIEISTGNSITGEDTPFYFWKEEVADRIKKLLPETKLIGIFRNPVDRAYSNYNLSVRMNVEKLTFEDAINEEIEYLENFSRRECTDRMRSYLSKGFYDEQMKIWFDKFPKKQIHILSTEDMRDNPQKTLQDIFRFLQVSDYEIQNPENQKAAEYDEMNDDIREKLLRLYKPHNEKFFQIINHRFNWDN
tara:strand:- start:8707 stop:9534 length:828 start_codon:yes stop_codon:yes gene_type:complete